MHLTRLVPVAVVVAALTAVGAAAPASSAPTPAVEGARWLASRQLPSGAFSDGETADATAEAVVALVAGGVSGEPVERALGYLARQGRERSEDKPAFAGRIVLGLVAAGQDPSRFGGFDHVAAAEAGYDPATGRYDTNLYANVLAALGVLAGRGELPERAVTYLRANACAQGGFSWREGCLGPPDTDTTATALMVLAGTRTGRGDPIVGAALEFLRRTQDGSGGFGLEEGDAANANSTGLALSAFAALGIDAASAPWRQADGDHPASALRGLQHPSGGFRYVASDREPNAYATVQAVPGVAGVALPHRGVEGRTITVERASPPPTTSAPAATPVAGEPREEGASPSGRVGLVVRGPDGLTTDHCLDVDGPVTGVELLKRADLDVTFARAATGTAVCRLGPAGCSADDCFCGYPTFWGYWTRDADTEPWTFSTTGAHARELAPGAMDAWVWGEDGEPPPPDELTLDETCAGTAPGSVATAAPVTTDAEPAGAAAPMGSIATVAVVLAGAGAGLWWRRRSV